MSETTRLVDYVEAPPDLPKRGIGEIMQTLGYLVLPNDEYFVIGGANLVLRGIKEVTPDIDMLVTESIFANLRRHRGAEIHEPPPSARVQGADNKTVWVKNSRTPIPVSATTALGDGYYPMSFESHREHTELVEGIPCLRLEDVRISKEALQRPRNIEDLELIAGFLGQEFILPEPKIKNWHLLS